MNNQPANQAQRIVLQMAQVADQVVPIAFGVAPAVSCVYRPWVVFADGDRIYNKTGVLIAVNHTHAPNYVVTAIDELEKALLRWQEEQGMNALP